MSDTHKAKSDKSPESKHGGLGICKKCMDILHRGRLCKYCWSCNG